jgi:hypothetical protein
MKTAFIICGALGREVLDIIRRHGWEADVFGIPAIDHMYPERIAPDVEKRFRQIRQDYDHVLVVYGDCGSRGALDEVLARYELERIDGPHCYEMYGGQTFHNLMEEEPGTFFLTDFLVRGFQGTIVRGLGLDRFPELKEDYFRHYRRVVYLVQNEDKALLDKASDVAAWLGLPLEIRPTGYGLLEQRLIDWMAGRSKP